MLTLRVLNQRTQHVSAPFVTAQIVMGPVILRVTRFYRRRSVMYKYLPRPLHGSWYILSISNVLSTSF